MSYADDGRSFGATLLTGTCITAKMRSRLGGPAIATQQLVNIEPATDQERAIATITMAFIADPIVRWFIHDSGRYLKYWPGFVSAFGGGAFANGSADVADNFAAVALWVPPGVGLDEEAMGGRAAEAVPESEHEEKFGLLGQMDEFHPTDPHWYLPLMGVDLPFIGRGLGSALLRHATTRADKDGVPSYLEATSPLNKRLYERHGFEEIGVIQFGSSPPMWPMVRPSR
jgi:GNAT superfamily N-acetyltransferase